jgi:hypothetical protein
LKVHIGYIATHSMSILSMLTGFRLKHLTVGEQELLTGYFAQVTEAFKHAFPNAEIIAYDD